MPRRLERILEPLENDAFLPELVSDLGNEYLNAFQGWPGDRTDTEEIEQARKFIDALEHRGELIARAVADLRAELARVEQTERGGSL